MEILKNIYENTNARMKTHELGLKFQNWERCEPGWPTFSNLFNSVLEDVFRGLDWKDKRIKIVGRIYKNRLADDVILNRKNTK